MDLSDFGNWKEIEGHPNYEVSDQGFVLGKKRMKILTGNTNVSGYPTVKLSHNGICETCFIHKLVARAFLDNPNSHAFVDHTDHNKLNNNVGNLRWCTRSENNRNTTKRSDTMSSSYKGVSWFKHQRKWCARIYVNCKRQCLGYFDSEVQAAVAYNNAAIHHFTEFACLNTIPIESVADDA